MEKHQLAGLDGRARGFNRLVELDRTESGYLAVFRHETDRFATDCCPTSSDALQELIKLLHARGYSQLRTQQSYRSGTYLGSQEPWIEYPDPAQPAEPLKGLLGWLCRRWRTP
jgi:hypothetical protein